ncbi:MAG: hypothetical protein NC405_06480 [Odoribacter sp.]|nr:hypothetical protein [Odoribacter sp.]
MNKDTNLLKRAFDAWLSLDSLRTLRRRHKRFTYGDQWHDMVEDPNGNIMEESRLITSSGKRPLTNNLIRQLVKTIVGRYRTIASEGAFYDNDPQSTDYRNRLCELDCRMLEEFVISGCAIQRVCEERRPGGQGIWVDNVSPDDFFVNDFRDPRGFDIDFTGMIHDMSLGEVINRFGAGNRRRCEALRHLFMHDLNPDMPGTETSVGTPTPAGADFFTPRRNRCRVIEVWQLRGTEITDPGGRRYVDMHWHCTWLAPDGTILAAYNSPYHHKSHPFAVKFYPLTDGEVHSFVEDVIDQQKTINRLVVLIDTMLASSAKGALLFPVEQLPKGVTLNDVARLWARPDSLIPINGRNGSEMPRQVVNNGGDAGAYQLLSLQMKLFEDVSGISDALLGRNISAATGASLYDAQVRNATITLTDLLETFTSFTSDRNAKINTRK